MFRNGVMIAGIIALMLVALWTALDLGRTVGEATTTEATNQENGEAGNAAEDWRTRYRRCDDRGGVFNYETSSCDE